MFPKLILIRNIQQQSLQSKDQNNNYPDNPNNKSNYTKDKQK